MKEKLTAVKEVKLPYADMHENLKIMLNSPIRNRYVVEFKTNEDIGQILMPLGIEDYEGIFIGNILEAFLPQERSLVLVIHVVIHLSLLNQVLLSSNPGKLSVGCKDFTTAKGLTTLMCVTTLSRRSKVCRSSF